MKKTFLNHVHDFFLDKVSTKILALFCTLAIWMVFSNIEDPEQTKSYTVPVNVEHTELLSGNDQYYEATGEENVTFRVTATRSTLEKLNNGDFVATADLKNLDDGRIPIEINANRFANSISIISATQYYYVEVGDIVTKTFPIEVEIEGEPTAPYIVSDVTVDPGETTVTGPDKIVNTIERVVAEVNATAKDRDVTANTPVHYLDAQGLEVDTSKLSSKNVSAAVNVEVLYTKQLGFTISPSGELAEGLFLREIKCDKDAVLVKGRPEILNSTMDIEIPDSLIDLSGVTDSTSFIVDINPYLQSGISLVDPSDAQLEITLEIAKEETREFRLSTDAIELKNVPDGVKISFENPSFNVTICGAEGTLDALDADEISCFIDCSEFKKGTYVAEVEVDLGDAYRLTDPAIVSVRAGGK